MVLEVNVNRGPSSKQNFKDYCTKNNVKFPAIFHGEGGTGLGTATGNGISGNPKYMIYPDKTFAKTGTIPSSIKEHVCGPTLKIAYPVGGEKLEQGSVYIIKWSSNASGNVKIELFKNGTVHKILENSIDNNGSYNWEITTDFPIDEKYTIKISSLDNTSLTSQSGEFSIKKELILSLPYLENFNDWSEQLKATGNWKQSVDDNIDWTIISGPTPSRTSSNPDKTGPEKGDYPDGNGKYIYVEASGNDNRNKNASIITPKFDFSTMQHAKLKFYYHMFSDLKVMGDFYIDVRVGTNSQWQEGIVKLTNNDYGDKWNQEIVDLNFILSGNYTNEQKKRVQFRLRGITSEDASNGWCSDICIDNFEIDSSFVSIINSNTPQSIYNIEFKNSKLFYLIPETEKQAHIKIKLFNLQGKLIQTLINETQKAGNHFIPFNRNNFLAKGVYFCSVKIAHFQKSITILNK